MKRLQSLSDNELTARLRRLVRREQDLMLEILPFLAEVDRRELYLKWAYSSLTDYCMAHLGYCESSAWRRVRVARVIKDFPEVYDLLVRRRVTFSAVILISRVIKPGNKNELLPRIEGQSQEEIRKIVAEYERPQIIRDQARPRIVTKRVDQQPTLKRPEKKKLGEIPLHCEGKKLATDENSTPSKKQATEVFERMYDVRFAADEELMEMVRWMKSYLSGRFPEGAGFLEMFKFAMGYVRDREDLTRRAERRKMKNPRTLRPAKAPAPDSRHIPQRVKEKVWTRDGGRCAYVGENGKRCNSTHSLQFDHYPVPFGRGGSSTAGNLRLLCARHNRFTAAQVYGAEHVERYRARRE